MRESRNHKSSNKKTIEIIEEESIAKTFPEVYLIEESVEELIEIGSKQHQHFQHVTQTTNPELIPFGHAIQPHVVSNMQNTDSSNNIHAITFESQDAIIPNEENYIQFLYPHNEVTTPKFQPSEGFKDWLNKQSTSSSTSTEPTNNNTKKKSKKKTVINNKKTKTNTKKTTHDPKPKQ
ncbi:hypothetical protein ABK040_004366 [Willaertia magna]